MAGRRGLSADNRAGLTLVAAPFTYALLLLALPIGAIILFSFWTQDFLDIDTTFTLANYREALTGNPIYRTLLGRSVVISLTVTVVTVLLAFPIAYFVSFHVHPSHKSLWLFLITIPFWTSYLIRVFLWKVILGYNGVLNTSLLGIGVIDEPLTFILYNANAVVITLAHAFAPFAILPIFVALEKIDRSLLEASRDLGETKVTTFFRVTLPLAMPGVVGAVLIVFIPTIGDYVTPRLVGGPEGAMIANMIQTQFLRLNNAPLGAALAILAMLSVTAISLAFVWLNREVAAVSGLRIYAIAYLVFLYAPILLLPVFAFNDGQIIAFPLQGFSTRWFGELWTLSSLHDAVGNSLFIAVVSAVFATILGVCAARAGARHSWPLKGPMLSFIMLPLVLPEIIVAVSLLIVFVQILDLGLSNWSIVAAHTLICMPFSIAILNGAFSNLDPAMEEAAMDLGETRWGAFTKITLPLVTPGIISSLLISFTISLDEFIIAFFLSGANPTMPVYIWGMLRFPERLPAVMALGTILVALSIALLVIAEFFRRRGLARAGLKDTGGFI